MKSRRRLTAILATIWLSQGSWILWSTTAFSSTPFRRPVSRTSLRSSTQSTSSIVEDVPRSVTPYQVLFADVFSETVSGRELTSSLFSTTQLLKETVERLAEKPLSIDKVGRILRVEHTLTMPIDPLGWLHAQDSGDTGLYFVDQEETMETACLGSSLILRDTRDMWRLWSDLPDGSNFYGGERFDKNSTISEEWSEFGRAFWMIPAVEMRRTKDNTTLAIHLYDEDCDWQRAAKKILPLVLQLDTRVSRPIPPTTLPPVLSRDSNYGERDGQEMYEDGVAAALKAFEDGTLEKVVLARRQKLRFKRTDWNGLDLIRRWKYGGHEGGHLFWLRPGKEASEFFGCTPERLFLIRDGSVQSEALAGTRPRGSTPEADGDLMRDLFGSQKDRRENELTAKHIAENFAALVDSGLTTPTESQDDEERFFVRRLLHLQHICQRFEARLLDSASAGKVSRFLLDELHPTPAVCGLPLNASLDFIREREFCGFDRGFYSGPFGYIGRQSSDVVVAIRSGLVYHSDGDDATAVSNYAGAGVVPGSTLQGEWAETNYKLGVISSIFPQSPISLQNEKTPNSAWATAFIEELIRNGVTTFYVCPGSRSTPLVSAIAKAARAKVGVLSAVSVHDERAAGFRAVGYGQAMHRPAAIVTSSGTAVSNLYPAVVEAGMSGVPLLLLTADRPYENRGTGANQAIDQVNHFSQTYVRWFRDIAPPSDDIAVSVALSDAGHAVSTARALRGPVHLNIQFRENLAPDGGQIRNDARVDSVVRYNARRFTDTAGFRRWSRSGDKFSQRMNHLGTTASASDLDELVELISSSTSALIVVGNVRGCDGLCRDAGDSTAVISDFAQMIGAPIVAGVQAMGLRFSSPAVIPFAEFLLKAPSLRDVVAPDLLIQIGAPLVSTEVAALAQRAADRDDFRGHVLIHPHFPAERHDPDFTVTHTFSVDVGQFLEHLMLVLGSPRYRRQVALSSTLAPLVSLGRQLASNMSDIVRTASCGILGDDLRLTEPGVMFDLADVYAEPESTRQNLFLSNSMPIRDAELFMYPRDRSVGVCPGRGPKVVGSNRGASGIDGIVSSALGLSEALNSPTTVIVGDLSALHDLGSFHMLSSGSSATKQDTGRGNPPLNVVVVNNNGGGIFSFLPIAKHGTDVAFEDFFGTPTDSFSFKDGLSAFGLRVDSCSSKASFRGHVRDSGFHRKHRVVEARVVDRETNVRLHAAINQSVNKFIEASLDARYRRDSLEAEYYRGIKESPDLDGARKTMILIHGWMGSKADCHELAQNLAPILSPEWNMIAVDLPGHGSTEAAQLLSRDADETLTLNTMAEQVLRSLKDDHGVERIDAIVGYSLGGRVAQAMARLSSIDADSEAAKLIHQETRYALISSFPGDTGSEGDPSEKLRRSRGDDRLAQRLKEVYNKQHLSRGTSSERYLGWYDFLRDWYEKEIWGQLINNDVAWRKVFDARSNVLSTSGTKIAEVLRVCSPPRNPADFREFLSPQRTLFVSGVLDKKYNRIGRSWQLSHGVSHLEVPLAGHALMTEQPGLVAEAIGQFVASFNTPPNVELRALPSVPKQVDPARATGSIRDIRGKVDVASDDRAKGQVLSWLDFEDFSIPLSMSSDPSRRLRGIGWERSASVDSKISTRGGCIVQLSCSGGECSGLGELSPLEGLHSESLEDAKKQLVCLRDYLHDDATATLPRFDDEAALRFDGYLTAYLEEVASTIGLQKFYPSVAACLEMALLGMASSVRRIPLLKCYMSSISDSPAGTHATRRSWLSLNGVIPRGSYLSRPSSDAAGTFPSYKVKVGHQSCEEDLATLREAFRICSHVRAPNQPKTLIRLDANRAWNESQAIQVASDMCGISVRSLDRVEYIEEPLMKVVPEHGSWRLPVQLEALERLYMHTGIPYALDESLADVVTQHDHNFESIADDLKAAFDTVSTRGCVALVLKPALLGIELSQRMAAFAVKDLGITPVFSSCFDTGLGLAHVSFLASLVESRDTRGVRQFAHGLGTYTMMQRDTIAPPFGSHVDARGRLNVASLSRSLYGLTLDDIQHDTVTEIDGLVDKIESINETDPSVESGYEASTAASGSGRQISVAVSLPLPFSADIAHSRFTDLPQQPRWSPWIESVSYQGKETEWKLNIRGIPLTWRATSSLVKEPYPGIQWESVSGLKNRGIVEFVPASAEDTGFMSTMNVQMTIVPPRMLQPLFSGTSLFIEDFLRDKLLKWSLEMFRDVVKGDLAVERGDVELGDALFSAVEGKASAIEATLKSDPSSFG